MLISWFVGFWINFCEFLRLIQTPDAHKAQAWGLDVAGEIFCLNSGEREKVHAPLPVTGRQSSSELVMEGAALLLFMDPQSTWVWELPLPSPRPETASAHRVAALTLVPPYSCQRLLFSWGFSCALKIFFITFYPAFLSVCSKRSFWFSHTPLW